MTAHPRYQTWYLMGGHDDRPREYEGGPAMIGDEVSSGREGTGNAMAIVVGIGLDGIVELSTGDQVPAADLVLLKRADL